MVQSYVNDVIYAEAYNITHTVRSSNYAYMEADRLGSAKSAGEVKSAGTDPIIRR